MRRSRRRGGCGGEGAKGDNKTGISTEMALRAESKNPTTDGGKLGHTPYQYKIYPNLSGEGEDGLFNAGQLKYEEFISHLEHKHGISRAAPFIYISRDTGQEPTKTLTPHDEHSDDDDIDVRTATQTKIDLLQEEKNLTEEYKKKQQQIKEQLANLFTK